MTDYNLLGINKYLVVFLFACLKEYYIKSINIIIIFIINAALHYSRVCIVIRHLQFFCVYGCIHSLRFMITHERLHTQPTVSQLHLQCWVWLINVKILFVLLRNVKILFV